MSAVGIDFGNENSYIAIAKAGGIEVITNDYSQRATPSYVAFGPKCRDIGTSAKNKFVTNLKNTLCSFKRLIGKTFKDPILQHEISYLPYILYEMPNSTLGVKVSYLEKESIFTVHQITAMLFTKLKDITETAVGTKIADCVVSVPVYFNDAERRALMDSCQIAGLNVLRLLNEMAAVALCYGFYRQDFTDNKPKKIVFIDIGHSAVQASVCAFVKEKFTILANAWDFCLGGRDIDNVIVRYFSQEFQKKYNLDVLSNSRAIVRLLQECEKLKKQLTVNPQVLPLNIECFMNDIDVSSSLGRDKLEELCSDILNRIETVFKRLIIEANLKPGEITAIELTGGSSRIPFIKHLIKQVFGVEPSTTLNLDEAIARGCAIQAAMLSPSLKVKELSIIDVQPYSIKLCWTISPNEDGEVEVFPKNHQIPFSKQLTFYRKEDFTLKVCYTSIKNNSNPAHLIGSFKIKNVKQMPSGDSAKIVVKLRINIHGIFVVRSAFIVDRDFKENLSIDQKVEDVMDLNIKNANVPLDTVVNEVKKKDSFFLKRSKKFQEIELEVEPQVPQLSESEMKTLSACEQRMILQDESEKNRINAKNSLEESVYEMRNKLSEELNDYIDNQELDDFTHHLNSTENWLYEEGEEQKEVIYTEKLSELKAFADPIIKRRNEHQDRPAAIKDFQQILENAQKILSAYLSGDQHYTHIDAKDMEIVQRKIDEKNQWLQEVLESLKNLKLYENPPLLVENINAEKEKLKQEIYPILSKPKSLADTSNKSQKKQKQGIFCGLF